MLLGTFLAVETVRTCVCMPYICLQTCGRSMVQLRKLPISDVADDRCFHKHISQPQVRSQNYTDTEFIMMSRVSITKCACPLQGNRASAVLTFSSLL